MLYNSLHVSRDLASLVLKFHANLLPKACGLCAAFQKGPAHETKVQYIPPRGYVERQSAKNLKKLQTAEILPHIPGLVQVSSQHLADCLSQPQPQVLTPKKQERSTCTLWPTGTAKPTAQATLPAALESSAARGSPISTYCQEERENCSPG